MTNGNISAEDGPHNWRKKSYKALESINDRLRQSDPAQNSLFNGKLCLSVYFSFLSDFENKPQDKHLAISQFKAVLADFNSGTTNFYGNSLASGYSGLVYTFAFLLERKIKSKVFIRDFELLAGRMLDAGLELMYKNQNDPLHGSLSIFRTLLYYAKVTGNPEYAFSFWQKVRKHFCKLDYPWIPNVVADSGKNNDALINYSFAHGQCGILRILLQAARTFGMDQDTRNFLIRNVDHILGLKKESYFENTNSLYGSVYDLETRTLTASPRLAWCYGDLGPLILFTLAGKELKKEAYINEANELGRLCARRRLETESSLKDIYLCHGTTGIAEIFNFLYAETQSPVYHSAYHYWMQTTLKKIDQHPEFLTDLQVCNNLALGLPGVGLSLMAYLSPETRHWRNIIML